jgi:beta-glucosidase
MVPLDAASFEHNLVALVREGRVPIVRIDEAVTRILTLKFSLGLFEHPYGDARQAAAIPTAAGRALARRAADETMTLLQNSNHLLPLPGTIGSILVAGPSADSVANQMGGWTVGWQGVPPDQLPPSVSVLAAIKQAVAPTTRVTYVADDGRAAARAASKAAVAIVVAGEQPYAEGYGDTETAALPADQQALIRAIEATGTPTVVVIVAGRPLMIGDLLPSTRALLMAYLPGSEGGHAIADVLFGAYDPSGRLPVSWPRRIGQVPLFYTYLPGTSFGHDSGYDPLFPFGYGQSYTSFTERNLRVTPTVVGSDSTFTVSVAVRNVGARSGDEIVQAYVHPDDSPVLVPPKRLVAFKRVHLRPGQGAVVTFTTPTSRLAVVPGDILGAGPLAVLPGHYTIMVGRQSAVLTIR